MGRVRERARKDKELYEQQIQEIKDNEHKHKRYYDFKQKFADVFDELEMIEEGKPAEKVEMKMIEADDARDKSIL